MLILPAIDISEEKCVRLTRGDFRVKSIYFDDPLEAAKNFENKGARMLHIVDLDGARSGEAKNMQLILKLSSQIKIPVQVGGGVRDFATIYKYLCGGVRRVILSTKALEDEAFLRKAVKKFGAEKILISVDIKNGRAMGNGWLRDYAEGLELFLSRIKAAGIKDIIVTDVSVDGTLEAPNFRLIKELQKSGLEIIAAGGVSSINDVKKLWKMGVSGVIIGKAIYEGCINLSEVVGGNSNLAKRIIPCLDVKEGKVVKGVNFVNLKDAGDAVQLAKRYEREGADELVFLDITASKEARKIRLKMVKKVAKEIFIPFTVGGGIKSVEEINELLNAGADKVAINSAALLNPELIKKASEKFGSQCIVVAIDVKKIGKKWKVFIKGGEEETQFEVEEWAKKVERLGAGEILLTSIDRDGTKKGFDLELLRAVSRAVEIPVIASGGAGSVKDFETVFKEGGVDGALAASIFHYKKISISSLKKFLKSNNISMRI